MQTLRIPSAALLDHMCRLYIGNYHSELKHAEIEVVKETGKSSIVNITAEAIEELIADLEYQAEFSPWDKAQNRYALKTITKQLGETK